MIIAAVVAAFLAGWIALYIIVLRPKLCSYRVTAGIYQRINAVEGAWWAKFVLKSKGLKVAALALVTSAAPIVAVGYDKMSGTDWAQLSHAHAPDLIFWAVGIVGPMVMAAVHNSALADASASTPAAPAPAAASPGA